MDLKQLGNTGVMVPEIGLGTWKYRGGVKPLQRGIELGAFLIDTAEMYSTEGIVGEASKGIRDKVFIATKVSANHLRHDDLMRSVEASLRRLDTDYIDLYQLHYPNRGIPIAETMGAMETLVDRGVVRHIGVSNFTMQELQEAQAVMAKHPVVCNQVAYSLVQRDIERDLLPYCRENDVTVIAYWPLGKGSLTAKPGLGEGAAVQVLRRVASQVDKTPAQVALNWCTSRPNVIAIPKSDSLDRTEENCRASGWRLSSEHLRLLEEAFPQA